MTGPRDEDPTLSPLYFSADDIDQRSNETPILFPPSYSNTNELFAKPGKVTAISNKDIAPRQLIHNASGGAPALGDSQEQEISP